MAWAPLTDTRVLFLEPGLSFFFRIRGWGNAEVVEEAKDATGWFGTWGVVATKIARLTLLCC